MGLIDAWHKKTGVHYRLGEEFVAQHPDTYTTTRPKTAAAEPKPAAADAAPEKKSARPARRTTARATEAK